MYLFYDMFWVIRLLRVSFYSLILWLFISVSASIVSLYFAYVYFDGQSCYHQYEYHYFFSYKWLSLTCHSHIIIKTAAVFFIHLQCVVSMLILFFVAFKLLQYLCCYFTKTFLFSDISYITIKCIKNVGTKLKVGIERGRRNTKERKEITNNIKSRKGKEAIKFEKWE